MRWHKLQTPAWLETILYPVIFLSLLGMAYLGAA